MDPPNRKESGDFPNFRLQKTWIFMSEPQSIIPLLRVGNILPTGRYDDNARLLFYYAQAQNSKFG